MTVQASSSSKTAINAIDCFTQNGEFSAQQVKQAMSKGAVWLSRNQHTQRLRRAKKNLRHGDTVHLYYDENILATRPPAATLINDEQAYSIWCKPYGMYSQGSKWGDHCTINRWVEQQLQRPTFIVHRLDRAARGLIILGHSKKTTAALARLFEQRKIVKCYRAMVHGLYPHTKKPDCIDTPLEGQRAISHVQLLSQYTSRNQSLLQIHIETGRKHQIRRHLSQSGFAIVGDRLYSPHASSEDLQLCSWSLEFNCPLTGQPQCISLAQHLTPDTAHFFSEPL